MTFKDQVCKILGLKIGSSNAKVRHMVKKLTKQELSYISFLRLLKRDEDLLDEIKRFKKEE